MVESYFALESAIVNRIQECVPELRAIYTPFNIEEMMKITNVSPSVSVIYFDDRIGDSAGTGKVVSTYQQWLVVLSLRHAAAQLQNTNVLRQQASPLILNILDAMQGFDPKIQGYKPFKRVNSPVRQGGQAGHCYFPFMFESQIFV